MLVRIYLVRNLSFSLLVPNKYKQKAENKIKENRNFYLSSVAEPVEATVEKKRLFNIKI